MITITEFKFNDNKDKVKVIKRVKRYTRTKRISKKAVERRQNWVKFGAATDVEENLKITFPSYDAIMMEDPNEETTKEDEIVAILEGRTSVVVCRNCGKDHWTLKCPYKGMDMGDIPKDDVPETCPPASSGTGGKFVPPHLRKGYKAPSGGGDTEISKEEM